MSLHSTSWTSILILLFYLRLPLPSVLFSLGFPTKTLYTPVLFPIRATYPTHLILDLITRDFLTPGVKIFTAHLPAFFLVCLRWIAMQLWCTIALFLCSLTTCTFIFTAHQTRIQMNFFLSLCKWSGVILLFFQMRWDPSKPAPTIHEFDKKLAEADAYLQILIDQIKVSTLCIQ